MKYFKKVVAAFVIGILIGATVYLTSLMVSLKTMPPTAQNILGLFLMSGLIGLLSLLFEIDHLPDGFLLLIHCLFTFGLVTLFDFLWSWHFILTGFLSSFFVIYLLIWLGIYGYAWLTARQLNRQLKQRVNQGNSSK